MDRTALDSIETRATRSFSFWMIFISFWERHGLRARRFRLRAPNYPLRNDRAAPATASGNSSWIANLPFIGGFISALRNLANAPPFSRPLWWVFIPHFTQNRTTHRPGAVSHGAAA